MSDDYNFEPVKTALETAKGIAWDECHKIYVLMDDQQMSQMHAYEYPQIISADAMLKENLLSTLREWYANSCGLRFIQSVATDYEDPNNGYENLIAQFYED